MNMQETFAGDWPGQGWVKHESFVPIPPPNIITEYLWLRSGASYFYRGQFKFSAVKILMICFYCLHVESSLLFNV